MVSTKEKDIIGRGLYDQRFRKTLCRIVFTFGMKASKEDAQAFSKYAEQVF